MLVLLYIVIKQIGIQLAPMVQLALADLLVSAIIIAGIIMLFGAVGMKISTGLGATIVGGLLSATGFIGRTAIQAIGWLVKTIWGVLPRVYASTKQCLGNLGVNPILSAIGAHLMVVITIAIII